MGPMIPKEMIYNLHCGDVRGDVPLPPHGTDTRNSDPRWLTSEIKKIICKRKRLYDMYKRTNCSISHEGYNSYRYKVTNEIRTAKNFVMKN